VSFTGNRDAAIFRDGFNAFADGGPAAGADLNFDQDDSFTLEALIRIPDGTSTVGNIVGKDVGGNQPSWWFRVQTDGTLQAIVDDNNAGTNVNGLVNGVTPVNDGEWHHVAFVRDADSDQVRLFLDYQLDAADLDETINTQFNMNDIRIGEFNSGGAQFIGDIDFVRISEGALATFQFVQPTAQIPEPVTGTLLLMGAMALMRRRRNLSPWERSAAHAAG
jgi:hypothetical protein